MTTYDKPTACHHWLLGGGHALGWSVVVVSLVDSLDPLVLLVLRPGQHGVGAGVVLVNQHEAVGPPRVSGQSSGGDVLHLIVLDLQTLLETVVISLGLFADQQHLVEDEDVSHLEMLK